MYKQHNYYNLILAEDGTSYGYSVALSRSKNIWDSMRQKHHPQLLHLIQITSVIEKIKIQPKVINMNQMEHIFKNQDMVAW
jgi:beta-xylosidase